MSSLVDAFAPSSSLADMEAKVEEHSHEMHSDIQLDVEVSTDTKPPSESGGNDDESLGAQDEDMHDLFGEDNDVEVPKHEEAATPASSEHVDGISSPERKHREAMEYAEEDEPEPVIEQVLEANAAIPNIPVPRSSDGNHWVIRMPNFVKVDSKPFHPDTYVGPEHEDEDAQHAETLREKSMTIKLKVENTVRWRWVKDQNGQDRRQSNSRVIRWSDGSLSLQLGKEVFDITQTIDTSGTIPRQAIGGGSQPASQGSQTVPQSQPLTPSSRSQAQGLTYLVAQHKRAEILQCEALVTGYMSLRPTGMQSETHRMLVRAVGQKHNKVARLRMAPDPTMDPEREKMELLKLAAKKTRKPKSEEDTLGGRRKRASYTRKRTGDDMWSDDEEEEEMFRGGSEEEYGDDDMGGRKAKRRRQQEETLKKGPGEYQTDDFLVADSDEENGDSDEAEPRKRKRRGRHEQEEEHGEEDDLDKIDAKIDQQEAEERKRRQRDGSSKGADGDAEEPEEDAMDIESEEEEEEHGVRRAGAGTGARKKRTIELEDEEE